MSRLLASLSRRLENGVKVYDYASAGGLYPVQAYLHVKPDRVEGLAGGTWYYRPSDHRLVQLVEDAVIDSSIHIPFINSPTFDSCAFSVFLISQLAAVAPIYGDYAMHFSTLEAGAVAHQLELAAVENGLGLCQMGSVEFDRVRHLFGLEESHMLIHSLVGGVPDPDEPPPGDGAMPEDDDEEGVI